MHWAPSRRRVLAALSASAAGLIGGTRGFALEALPETTTIRLAKIPGVCIAPQYVAEELLRA
jgi:NitT/TauT family transport system substrate-binding protein